MRHNKYLWNIEHLNHMLQRLRTEYEILKESRDFVSQMETEVQEQWQSVAGTAYENRLDVDMGNYDRILADMQNKINHLDTIANRCYQNCEDEIKNKVIKLQGRISAF